MPKLAANLTMMFCEQPFLQRFAAARANGFKGVEYHFPYDWPENIIATKLEENGLEQVLFNLPPGDWDAGERGLAALPGREQDFKSELERALDYAAALGCTRLHALAGIIQDENDRENMEDVFVENLRLASQRCADAGVSLMIEPINTIDMPGYFLNTSKQALVIINRVGVDNLFLQFDIYHQQIMEGNLTRSLSKLMPRIGHIQIASVPDRHEPDTGEVNDRQILNHLDETGYRGWVGCEYLPKGNTEQGLGWAAPWGIGKK